MAVVAFDPLEYAQQLEAAGMPRDQAVVVAKGLCSMFVHNFDALVTKDYLDARFEAHEARIEANMDRRFGRVDTRLSDVYLRFERVEARLGRMELIQALTLAALVIPVAQALLTWWG